MHPVLGKQTLAKAFLQRFNRDFPEFKNFVRFLEFPSRENFRLPQWDLNALIDRVAQCFRPFDAVRNVKPLAFEKAVFDALAKDMPFLGKNELCATCARSVEKIPSTILRRRPGKRLWPFDPEPIAIVIGPDQDTPIGSLLPVQDTDLPSLSLRDDLDACARTWIYDHEVGHVLLNVFSVKYRGPNLRTAFEEAVCDSYALLRCATEDSKNVWKTGQYVSTLRTYMCFETIDFKHYTTPVVLRTMEEIEAARLPASPRALFDQAVRIASQTPITMDMLNGYMEETFQQRQQDRQQNRQDFYAFFKDPA